MGVVLKQEPDVFMSVKQVADYLHLNEKKIYALVNEGKIPATKVTGKWMFPRELVDRWMMESAHGGLFADRLVITGSDDPLLYRLVLDFSKDIGAHALVCYTPTGTRLGLDLLQAQRADTCCIHWGPDNESQTRHPALLKQYTQHPNWVLIRAFRREQGLMVSPSVFNQATDPQALFDQQFRWALRQPSSGAQRFLLEVLCRCGLTDSMLNSGVTALSEREAASAIILDQADVAPGARATATEYGLSFISFGWESFDFVLPRGIWFRRLFQDLLGRLGSAPCLRMAEQLTGYEFSETGLLVWGDD
ncbi:MAG TPA: helix-turn-helix domain-containing protein [Chromatiales bacterium]|nr:helix-turn-helix domain-containing protein [Chromatiales bacterium]